MRLLIIGGNAAGMTAAARARRVDHSLDITVVEKTEWVSWGRCGLPYYVEGQIPSTDSLVVHSAEYFRSHRRIDVRTGANAAAVQHSRRQVVLDGGERLPYDKLVVATGSRPDTSSIAGAEHAFALYEMQDGRRLRAALLRAPGRAAAVVGAGYLGLEVAGALRAMGSPVSVFEQSAEILGFDDPALTDTVKAHLERSGVDLRLGCRVSDIAQTGCEVVVLAAGFRPNVELAVDAGIDLGRSGAIRTGEYMETNLGGIYAAGDCAEVTHAVSRRPALLPLGTNAGKTGRVAGANAAGRRERLPGLAGTVVVRVCGLAVGITGLSERHARRNGFEAVAAGATARDRGIHFFGADCAVQLVAERRSGRLLGGWVAGESSAVGRINVLAAAVTAGMRVDEFQYMDLGYAPPYASVWDPLLIAAQQLVKAV